MRSVDFALQMTVDIIFDPELRLVDGTVIQNARDAIAVTRRQARSGSAEAGEILGLFENATRPEECEAAGQRLRSWIVRVGLLA